MAWVDDAMLELNRQLREGTKTLITEPEAAYRSLALLNVKATKKLMPISSTPDVSAAVLQAVEKMKHKVDEIEEFVEQLENFISTELKR